MEEQELKGARVLVADANITTVELLEDILSEEGCCVEKVYNGEDALFKARRILPDIILLDITMPLLDGLEVCQQLRVASETRLIPVIIITVHRDRANRMKAIKVGADDFLTKPVDKLELVTRVKSLYKRKKYLDDMENVEVVLYSLSSMLDARCPYTANHSQNVSYYSTVLGQRMGLSKKELDTVRRGALLHDIGKILVSDTALNKPDKLTDKEWDLMKMHPIKGANLMGNLKHLKDICPIILYHHEKLDGCGYPYGLKGDQIPLLARIVAVCDGYDALINDRPYRRSYPVDDALDVLKKSNGHQHWDQEIVEKFTSIAHEVSKPDLLYWPNSSNREGS